MSLRTEYVDMFQTSPVILISSLVVLGLVFAALMSVPIQDQGFVLSYPVGQLVLILIIAAFAGVLAAIAPARRASRVDVLQALAYE